MNFDQMYSASDDIIEDVILTQDFYEDDDDYTDDYDDEEAYDDDEEMELADEYDDDAYFEDDHDLDDASEEAAEIFGRKRRRRRRARAKSRSRRLKVASGKAFRPSPVNAFRSKGLIRTPAGQATVKLPKNIATKEEVKKVEKKVLANNKAVLVNGKAIISNGKAISRNASLINRVKTDAADRYRIQAKKIKENAKRAAAIQQSMMISTLMGGNDLKALTIKAPNFGTDMGTKPYLTVAGVATDNPNEAANYPISVQNSQQDNSSALLALAMNGGMGGSGNSNDMMMPMMLIAMGNSGDNNNMMMLLAMTMMNK